jgi:serine protease Do
VTPELAENFGLKETQGILVSDVSENSPAAEAGMKRGDIILEFDGKKVNDPVHLRHEVAHSEPGKKVPVKIWRKGKEMVLHVTIEELPKEVATRSAPQERLE